MPPYSSRFYPPAPLVDVTVENPHTPDRRVTLQAIIDTGADITAIPESVVSQLLLQVSERIKVAGLDGKQSTLPTFIVNIRMTDLTIERVEVIGWPSEEIVLGRDLLSNFEIFLDGKNRQFEIRDP